METNNYSASGCDFESLRLKVLDDMRNGRLSVNQEFHRCNISKLGVGEGYITNRFGFEVDISRLGTGKKERIIFVSGLPTKGVPSSKSGPASPVRVGYGKGFRNNLRLNSKGIIMFLRSRQFSQKSKVVISPCVVVPSWIWLITPQSRVKLLGDFPAGSLSDGFLEVRWVGSEREMAIPESSFFSNDVSTGSVSDLVEGVPKIQNNVGGKASRFDGDIKGSGAEQNFVIPKLLIELSDHHCRLRHEGSYKASIKLIDLL